MDTETKLVVARGRCGWWAKWVKLIKRLKEKEKVFYVQENSL